MKKIILFALCLFLLGIGNNSKSQSLGINNTGAAGDASSILDLSSSSKGLLIPRMLETERTAIGSPAIGLMVYQTNGTSGFYYYDGASWIKFIGNGSGDKNWLTENSSATAASTSSNQYVTGKVGIGNYSTSTIGSKLEIISNGLAATLDETSGISLVNTTAAGAGAQQMSPAIKWSGNGWATTPLNSQPVEFAAYLLPVEAGAAPSANLIFASSINSATYTPRMTLTSAGSLTLTGGITTAGAVSLNTSSGSTSAVSIGGTTGAQTINIGSAGTTGVKTVNLGSSGNAAHVTNINSGTTGAGAVNINNNVNSPVNIATGTSTGTVTIGNTTGNVNIPKLSGNALVATDGSDNLVSIAAGTSGQVLTSNGSASAPTWSTPTSGTVTNVSGTSPISVSNGTTTPAISIADADANGSTKGAATFTAADFNATTGNISIDYINGQKATSTVPGFLTSTDWSTFNGKENALTFSNGLTRSSNAITLGGALTTATTISGLSATNKMSFTGSGVDAFNVDGTTLSVDATNNRIGIGTTSPNESLHVMGNTRISGLAGTDSRPVYADANGTLVTNVPFYNLNSSLHPSNDDITGWNNIRTTCSDDATGSFSWGFNFKINGVNYTSGWISTNGILGFGSTVSTAYTNTSLPSSISTDPMCFFRWDDDGSNLQRWVVLGTSPQRICYIHSRQSESTSCTSGTSQVDVYITLHETSNIMSVRYVGIGSLADTQGAGATFGFQFSGGASAYSVPLGTDTRLLDDNNGNQSWSIDFGK